MRVSSASSTSYQINVTGYDTLYDFYVDGVLWKTDWVAWNVKTVVNLDFYPRYPAVYDVSK